MALADDMAGAAAIAVTPLAVAGSMPNQRNYEQLVAFGKAQYESYAKLGVMNPSLGPFEALGRSYASDPILKVTFLSVNASGSVSDFIDRTYNKVYGTDPTPGAKAALAAQVSYFENLYLGAGIAARDASLQAKGAVFGQIIGYAFTDSAAAAMTGLDDIVNPLVAKGNAGNFADFGGALPRYKAAFTGQAEGPATPVTPESAIDELALNPAIRDIFVANPDFGGHGQNDPVGDLFIQLIGTQGNPGTGDLLFG